MDIAYDLLPNVTVDIANQQYCEHVKLESASLLRCEITPLVFVGRYLSQEVSGVYLNVSVTNPDGGYQLMYEPIFATNDCPDEGAFGRLYLI